MTLSMREAFLRLKQRLLERRPHEPQRDEVHLVSFPGCGRSWVRTFLARAIANHIGIPRDQKLALTFSFAKLAELCDELPLIHTEYDDLPHWRRPHELAPAKEEYAESGVIFLSRDPRDLMVSLYFELSKRLPKYIDEERAAVPEGIRKRVQPFTGTLSEFVQQETGGFDSFIRYFNIWAANRQAPAAFMLMRYEDLCANTRLEANRMLEFIGVDHFAPQHVDEAIEFAQSKNKLGGKAPDRAGSGAGKADQAFLSSCRGDIGCYRDYLPPADAYRMSQYMRTNLSPYFRYKVQLDANPG